MKWVDEVKEILLNCCVFWFCENDCIKLKRDWDNENGGSLYICL